jgi:quercetin dioxygenase-like cupin family protein
MTLSEVAEQAKVSTAHLSRIEKGERQPSIGLLLELARVYSTTIGELVGEEPGTSFHLVRAGSGRVVESAIGPFVTLSGLRASAALSAVQLELPPGTHNSRKARHDGEEWLYVVNGKIEVEIGSEHLKLGAGDALHFDARASHQLGNTSARTATVVIVSTRPS